MRELQNNELYRIIIRSMKVQKFDIIVKNTYVYYKNL